MRVKTYCGICRSAYFMDSACRICANRRNEQYKERNAEKVKAARSEYKKRVHAAGAQKRAEAKALRQSTLRDRRRASKDAWKMRNKGAVNESTARRFASKHRATPAWADVKLMADIYTLALIYRTCTGIEYHVDHMVPIRSPEVCGLHVPANLMPMEAALNISKGNRWWPDMWSESHSTQEST